MAYMAEKIRKTLYIPAWIAECLDSEGEKYNGPGILVSAAISLFQDLPPAAKIAALRAYRNKEISLAYGIPSSSADVPIPPVELQPSRNLMRIAIAQMKEMVEVEQQQPGTVYRVLSAEDQKVLNDFRRLVGPKDIPGKKKTKAG